MITTKLIVCPLCDLPNRVVPYLSTVECRNCGKTFELKDPFVGEQVGEYKIQEKLGQGREGNVYLGISDETRKKVAIKSLNPIFSSTESSVKRFFFEANVIERLVHPNIVRGFGIIEKSKKFFLIQEYIEGVSLEDYIKRNGTMSWPELAPIARKLCNALEYAHSQQIIHRDIKPSNIMLDISNEPKLADFGISKSLDYTSLNITEQGQTVGTPSFMAPEVCSGAKASPRTDIYSLGICVYCMLVGKKPILGETIKEILMNQILQQPPNLKDEINAPENLSHWVSKMIHKNPEERFQNISEVIVSFPEEN